VAFTYGGDIWTAPARVVSAIRVTAHPGIEVFAKFSPDGKWSPSPASMTAMKQVYVVPSTGGVPRQLTFYPRAGPLHALGWDYQVYGWTRDGKRIIFKSLRDS